MRWKRSLVALCLTTIGVGVPGAAANDEAPGRMACQGNEPFWQFQIDGPRATYQRLGGAAIDLAGHATSLDYLPRPELVWRGRAALLDGDLVAWITEERCLDTMSDREGPGAFSHRVLISMPGGEVLVGCCRRPAAGDAMHPEDAPIADLASKPVDDWSRLLLDLAAAIETCLGATPGPVPRVTKAWPMNRGMVGVRTRNDAGGWFACVAPARRGALDRFEPVPAGTRRLPGEGAVVFSPAAQSPPAGVCYQHERVLGADNELLGWLSYDTC